MADFNKKHIGALILEKTGAAPECAEIFEEKRTALRFDASGTYAPVSGEDKIVTDRLEEERNYLNQHWTDYMNNRYIPLWKQREK